ncbi:hypothetical protein [uncultured Bacteroides sp.]|uniref:hypothetical protein n=1 Tax=uncultured Bacteroides sp. TaxID=162156 RepID=UPI0025E6A24E|nr:hypothetical protein [uncultured Bacteroides sp.]
MGHRKSIYHFLLHYGISFILLIMMMGIAYMLQVMEIKEKVSVDLFYNHHYYIAYIDKSKTFSPSANMVIEIDTNEKKKLLFRIVTVTEEESLTRMELKAETDKETISNAFAGNSKLSGYIYVDAIKLWDLIFSKSS